MVNYEELMNICIRQAELIKKLSELLSKMEQELGLYCLIDAEEKVINDLNKEIEKLT